MLPGCLRAGSSRAGKVRAGLALLPAESSWCQGSRHPAWSGAAFLLTKAAQMAFGLLRVAKIPGTDTSLELQGNSGTTWCCQWHQPPVQPALAAPSTGLPPPVPRWEARTLGRDGVENWGGASTRHQVPTAWEGSAAFPEGCQNDPRSRADDDQMSDTRFVLHSLCF